MISEYSEFSEYSEYSEHSEYSEIVIFLRELEVFLMACLP